VAVSVAPWRVPERIQQVRSLYEQISIHAVLEEIWRLHLGCRFADSEQKPWTSRGFRQARELEAVLWIAADTLRAVAVLAHPVIPLPRRNCGVRWGRAAPCESSESTNAMGTLRAGTKIAKAETLFRERKNKRLWRGWRQWKRTTEAGSCTTSGERNYANRGFRSSAQTAARGDCD